MSQQRIGSYRILERIAAGGQATVYRAWDSRTGQVVALKVMHEHLVHDPSYLERFVREARLAASISHPNIVRIFEVDQAGETYYMSLEYLPLSLHDLIRAEGRMPIERAVDIAHQIALGLAAAHERGIVHRDIKPQNILIDPSGTVKVTDFGISRAVDLATMTRTGAVMGTPHYMSPEQAKGERVDIRSDLYSLGIALFEMLTGELPFNAETPWEVIRKHIEAQPTPVRRLHADIPQSVERIVTRCMEKDPSHRFQTPQELASALAQAIPGIVTADATRPASPSPRPTQPPQAQERATRPAQAPPQPSPQPIPQPKKGSSGRIFTVGGIIGAIVILVIVRFGVSAIQDAFFEPTPFPLPTRTTPLPAFKPAVIPTATPTTELDFLSEADQHYNTGIQFQEQGLHERAMAEFDQAISLNPQDGDAYLNRGFAYYSLGDLDIAIRDFTQAIRLNPQDAQAYTNRGSAYYELERYERAIRDYEQAISIDPQFADVYYNRGLAYLYLPDLKRAIQDFSTALDFNSGDADAYAYRGLAYTHLSMGTEAQKDFEQARLLGFDRTLLRQLIDEARVEPLSDVSPLLTPTSKPQLIKPVTAGDKIAYSSGDFGNYQLYIMNTDGTGRTRLTRSSTNDYAPSWSPDGSKVAFYSDR
ncbi:MAG: tetratricopeptide repeat protein, partial [Dehalococcoidia bacterium]